MPQITKKSEVVFDDKDIRALLIAKAEELAKEQNAGGGQVSCLIEQSEIGTVADLTATVTFTAQGGRCR